MRQLLFAGLMVLSACWAWADGMVMKNFTIDVVLQADGSARITEVWDVQMNTDKYGELFNSYASDYFGRICDITVSDNGNMLAVDDHWDIDAPAAKKVGHCGLVSTDDGETQICWGIDRPGNHRYELHYTATSVLAPNGDGNVLLNIPLLIGNATLPTQRGTATITRADSALTSDDIINLEIKGVAKGGFDNGHIVVQSTGTLSDGDYMAVEALLTATAFGQLNQAGLSTEISKDEMSSTMMRDDKADAYQESLWSKVVDFYNEWPIATLLGILVVMVGLFYLIKKIVIALL